MHARCTVSYLLVAGEHGWVLVHLGWLPAPSSTHNATYLQRQRQLLTALLHIPLHRCLRYSFATTLPGFWRARFTACARLRITSCCTHAGLPHHTVLAWTRDTRFVPLPTTRCSTRYHPPPPPYHPCPSPVTLNAAGCRLTWRTPHIKFAAALSDSWRTVPTPAYFSASTAVTTTAAPPTSTTALPRYPTTPATRYGYRTTRAYLYLPPTHRPHRATCCPTRRTFHYLITHSDTRCTVAFCHHHTRRYRVPAAPTCPRCQPARLRCLPAFTHLGPFPAPRAKTAPIPRCLPVDAVQQRPILPSPHRGWRTRAGGRRMAGEQAT